MPGLQNMYVGHSDPQLPSSLVYDNACMPPSTPNAPTPPPLMMQLAWKPPTH